MKPKSNIIHLPVYQPGKPIEDVKRELGLTEIVKLASNENLFGFSAQARKAMTEAMDVSNMYPDGASVQLTNRIAEKLKVATNQLIMGSGSSDIILMIARAFLVPGDETIMADETFGQYKHNAEIENARIIEVPLKDGVHDLPAMLEKVTDQTKVCWICNPNNPTGTIVTNDELHAFMKAMPAHVLVVLDEAYGEYVQDDSYSDGVRMLNEYPNLVVLRTFSKIYGLAALRIGYGVGQEEVIRTINQVREPFNTTRIAQAAAEAAIADDAFVNDCCTRNGEGNRYLCEQFERMGLSYFPSHGNFVMVDVRRSSLEVFDRLLQKGVIVRPRWTYYPTHIRVTIGLRQQNETFIQALEQVLQEVTV